MARALAASLAHSVVISVMCSGLEGMLQGVSCSNCVRSVTVSPPIDMKSSPRAYIGAGCAHIFDRLLRSPHRSVRKLLIQPPCHPHVGMVIGKAMLDGAPLTSLTCKVMDSAQVTASGPGRDRAMDDPGILLRDLPSDR